MKNPLKQLINTVYRFNDVQEVLSMPDVFRVTYAPMMDPSVGPFMLGRDCTVINQRDKGIMRAVLNQRYLPEVRESVRIILNGIIEDCKNDKRINIVSCISRKCPALFTQQYFGFENATIEEILRWSKSTQHDMFHNLENDKKVHDANIKAGHEMRVCLKKLMDEKKEAIRNGKRAESTFEKLIAIWLSGTLDFDDDRVLSNTMGLLVGGIETTSQAIVQIVNQLFNRPEIFSAAVSAALSDDDKFTQYCWESLRFDPITPGVFRECTQDYTIAKYSRFRRKKLKAGSRIFVATGIAMKDKSYLDKPEQFKIDRPAYQYMHFGYGLHTCLGDEIAKVQIPEIVKAIITLPNICRVSDMEKEAGDFPSKLEIEWDV